jgi:glycerol uptake facilitator-like aquaporin
VAEPTHARPAPFLLIYILGPLAGAVVAVLLYLRILSEPGAKGVGGAEPVG